MQRITHTEKWNDAWFKKLSKEGKLAFIYLCENCNKAGFYSLHSGAMKVDLGFASHQEVVDAVLEINKAFIFNADRKKIWITNFLLYQKMLPLNSTVEEHKEIIFILEKNLKDFGEHEDIQFILDRIENKKTKKTGQKKFKKPTGDEFKAYAKEYCASKGWEFYSDEWVENLYDHYETRNWKPKGYAVQMTDWKAAMRNALRRQLDRLPKNGNQRTGRMTKLEDANAGLDDVDYDTLTAK